jgi:hypothetical protein
MSLNNVTTSPETVKRNEMSTPQTSRRTNSGNAELFPHLYKDRLRYDQKHQRYAVESLVQIAQQQAAGVRLQSSVNNDVPAEISLDDPRLTEVLHENPDGDAYDREKLQHGLCYDSEGKLRVKPEIEQALSPEREAIANRLLDLGESTQANAFIACGLLQKIHGICDDEVTGEWHDAYITSTFCNKLFLCAPCSRPKSRVRKFRNDYPYLFQHLIRSTFHVMTFTIADGPSTDPIELHPRMVQAVDKCRRFADFVDGDRPRSESGWKFLAVMSFTETKFYAIYQGPKLPGWPALNAEWQAIAGPGATFRCKMFDGKDEDNQRKGLELAHSGFVDYHIHVQGTNRIPFALDFTDFDTSLTLGLFRGFDVREEKRRATQAVDEDSLEPSLVELCDDGFEHAVPIACSRCGKPIKHSPLLPMMTVNEILAKGARIYFGHSVKPIYAKCGHVHNPRIEYRTLEADELVHAPPS